MDNQNDQTFTPAVQPQPEPTPNPQSAAQPAAQPMAQPAAQPMAQPAAQPAAPTWTYPARCPVCGAPTVPGRPFCGNCGASLPRIPAPVTAPPAAYAAGAANPNPYTTARTPGAPGVPPAYVAGAGAYAARPAPKKKKSKKGLVVLLVLVMLLAAVAFVLLTLKTPVTSVTLSETSTIELPIGQTKTLTYSVSPYDADCDTVTWTSSNTSVATVSDGKITAKGKGTCTITVTVNEGKDDQHTASVSVKVGKAVKEIELSVGTVELKVGEEHTITYEITPSDAMTGVVSWESSDETVATVKNGKIEAKKLGTCTITFTAGGKSATATVKVVTLYSEETQIVGTWKGYAYLEGDETVPLSSGTTYLYLYSDGTGRMTISGTTPLDFVWEYTEYEDESYFYDVTYTSISGTTQMMSFELSSGKDCVAFKLGSMIVVYTK